MLQFESVFWVTKNKEALLKKFQTLGFNSGPSTRDPKSQAVYFGPEAIEIASSQDGLVTLSDQDALASFTQKGDGIFGIGLYSDDIVSDYRRARDLGKDIEKPRRATDSQKDIPIWTGFNLPSEVTPSLRAWVVMNSKQVLEQQSRETLPVTHPNTCFGIEAVHMVCEDPEAYAISYGKLFQKQSARLQWNDLGKTQGKRFQTGFRFFDILMGVPGNPMMAATGNRDGVFMLTLRVADLEKAKEMAVAAGANVVPCNSRDGFIIPSEFTGGPSLRMVRTYWKRFLPVINDNYPYGRRTDEFRPLGGAYSSTLEDGFEDNWKY
jgi:hypothetical protein